MLMLALEPVPVPVLVLVPVLRSSAHARTLGEWGLLCIVVVSFYLTLAMAMAVAMVMNDYLQEFARTGIIWSE
ncbi:hypothetical protein [Paenibacillus lentus]|uniref:Uncharacterized protein n=1 Tax=Paenibacillus lentus TaxID=1338368 RepID=A0A3S8RQY1_9BACL|nr:hypothetical protein [Paenibacillus lentus]AZK45259.1 hypothetical protein EIM92_02800 [Paenibacillus lentus]